MTRRGCEVEERYVLAYTFLTLDFDLIPPIPYYPCRRKEQKERCQPQREIQTVSPTRHGCKEEEKYVLAHAFLTLI